MAQSPLITKLTAVYYLGRCNPFPCLSPNLLLYSQQPLDFSHPTYYYEGLPSVLAHITTFFFFDGGFYASCICSCWDRVWPQLHQAYS